VHGAARGLVGEARGSDVGTRGSIALGLARGSRAVACLDWWLDRWVQVIDPQSITLGDE
jgi:hypothetical protein